MMEQLPLNSQQKMQCAENLYFTIVPKAILFLVFE